jgi:hypothetical protein
VSRVPKHSSRRSGRPRHGSRTASPAGPAAATTLPRETRLATKTAHALVGTVCGSSNFINNWAASVLLDVARTTAHGSTSFVVLTMAAESLAVTAIMLVMVLRRRNVAAPLTRTVSTWVAAAGMLAPALVPNRLTLFAGFIALAWMGQAVSTLRSVVSDAPGDRPADGQQRVQNWIYRVLLGMQLCYVGVATVTGSWRYANAVVAAVLVVQGAALLISREIRQADPHTVDQPGSDEPLLSLIRYRPVVWAVLSVTLSWVAFGMFTYRAQSQLTTFGLNPTAASWIVVAVGATRAVTFRRRPVGETDGELVGAEAHHGWTLVNSSSIMVLSAAALAATLLPVGKVAAIVALAGAGVLSQFAMHRSNPIVREYVAERSIDASNLLNLGGYLGVFIGGSLPAFMSWPQLVATWGLLTAAMLGIAWATMGHRYEADAWKPRVPQATAYEFTGTRAGPLFRFEIRPGGVDPLPAYQAGPGSDVRLKAPINAAMQYQYWPSRPFFSILWRPQQLDMWIRRRAPRRLGRSRIVRPASEPALVLIADLDRCLVQDGDGAWYVNLWPAIPRDAVLARGTGPAPFMADDLVRAEIRYEGVTGWELISALILPEGAGTRGPLGDVEWRARLTASGREQIYSEPARQGSPARWVIPASALELHQAVVTRAYGDFPAGTLVAVSPHY